MRNHFFSTLCFATVTLLAGALQSPAANKTKVKFDFSSLKDSSGTYTATLANGAQLSTWENHSILDLGTSNGYLNLGSTFGSFIASLDSAYSISTTVYIPSTTTTTGAGNFVWCFSKSSSSGYLMFSAKDSRFAITQTNWSGETSITATTAMKKGRWVTITYQQNNGTGSLYIDGEATTATVSLLPKSISRMPYCYLGRSCYSSDVYLSNAKYAELSVTNYALSDDQLSATLELANELNQKIDSQAVADAASEFTMPDMSELTEDITLPTTYGSDVTITWSSSDESVITSTGHITRPAHGSATATATLTATLSCNGFTATKQFEVGVLPEFDDQEAAEYAAAQLELSGNLNNLYEDLTLPTTGKYGTVVVWSTSDSTCLSKTGHIVKRPAQGEGHKHVVLTATFVKGEETYTRDYDVYVHEDEPYNYYLFAYFPSNSNENIYYALSTDGYNYTPINDGNAVLTADTTTVMQGLRDPYLMRGRDGMFYMVATDMKSSLGWSSNRGIVMMKSPDLIHWEHHTVHFPTRFADTDFANVTRVWAPEVIWDPNYENTDGTLGRYMVYFSILGGPASYDKDYYCYANDDFSDLLDEPQYLYDRGSATIDMDIVYNETDSLYHAFYKNEGEGGICKVTARRLTPEAGQEAGSQWSDPSGTLQQTTESVEGAGVFKLINSSKWILMYDCYQNGHYQFCSSDDLSNFTFVQNTTTSGAFTPRHGAVIAISTDEAKALLEAFPNSSTTATIAGARNANVRSDYMVIGTDTVFIPVEVGTDISHFDPQLYANAGATVSPTGEQDFSNGPLTYTVTADTITKEYQVRVEADGNPILPGFHADPEVLYSKHTGRFYVYPTTDGYSGWGGYSFNVFSSPDLVHFTDEDTILNLKTDVSWADGNAWAPCIEEKYVDGQWKYYFYYSGNNTSLGVKTIGVAVASSPTGPFTPQQTPLFTTTSGGQMIDADVFTDPVSGKSYLYYGNGQMHWRQLGDDMISVGDEHTITPSGGSLSTYAYREGTYVFYRNGIYYFLWSVDDTGSKNYHVAYGTSTSPEGPITVASQPIVIIQNPSLYIYGTAHNSIVNVPGTDDWYIVYHRINRNYVSNGPGYHREVCVDKLTFNDDGTIAQTTPTRVGIDPVSISDLTSKLTGITEINANDAAGIVSERYYNLAGQMVGTSEPTSEGIYIDQQVLSNGQKVTKKIMIGK